MLGAFGLGQQRVHGCEQAAQLHVRLVLRHRQRVVQGTAVCEQPQPVNDQICVANVCFTGAYSSARSKPQVQATA